MRPPDARRTDPEEIAKLMRFIAVKTKNAEGPMSMVDLCRQFRSKTDAPVNVDRLVKRIQENRHRIPGMNEFNLDTRAKMMMAVRAKIDDGFLIELRKEADVEVDYQYRIIRYEKKRSTGASALSSANTSGIRKRVKKAPESSDDNVERMSDGEGTSDCEDPSRQRKNVPVYPESLSGTQGIARSGAIVKREINQESTSSTVKTPEEPSTSVLYLLVLLRGAVMSVGSSSLSNLLSKIEEKIQKLSKSRDRHIQLETINLAFDPCLFMLMTHSSPKTEEESTNLRSFLHFVRSSTCHLDHPSMTRFHEKLKTYLEELEVQNKRIPIKIVHIAMDSVINFINP